MASQFFLIIPCKIQVLHKKAPRSTAVFRFIVTALVDAA